MPVFFDRQIAKAAFGMPLGTPLNVLLNFTVIGLGVALVRVRPLWGMFVLTTVGIVLLVPKPQERYFLPVLPLLVYAWWSGIRWVNQRLPARWANWAFLGLFALVGRSRTVRQVMGFIGEQRYVPFLRNYKEGRYASVYEAADMVQRNTPPSGAFASPETTWVLVPSKFARIITCLTGRYAIEPDDGTPVNPWIGGAWQHFYVLEPTEPDKPDPTDKRPSVHEWLSARKFEVAPEVIATVENKDPGANEPWTLHRIQADGGRATSGLGRPRRRKRTGRVGRATPAGGPPMTGQVPWSVRRRRRPRRRAAHQDAGASSRGTTSFALPRRSQIG